MAAPDDMSLRNLSGKWKMNKDLSASVDGALQIQGFSSITRKIVHSAPINLSISQKSEGEGVTRITIDQSTTANISTVKEEWITDWTERDQKDPALGNLRGKSRWTNDDNVEGGQEEKQFLDGQCFDKEGEDGKRIETMVTSLDEDWRAHHLWGFERFDGQRYFTRRVVVANNNDRENVKLVYNFEGY